jgi:hypothetical protein
MAVAETGRPETPGNGSMEYRMFNRKYRTLGIVLFAALLPASTAALLQAQTKTDACALLTRGQIQEILGQPVKDKINTGAARAANSACEFMIGDYGVFSILVTAPVAANYGDILLASMKKTNTKIADAPGIGDKSFFALPGYGMLQLNTFSKSSYLIITMMVPGLTEDAQKPLAEKLMKLALAKL